MKWSIDLEGDGSPAEEGAREDPDELDALLSEPEIDISIAFFFAERFFFSVAELRLFWNQIYVDSGLFPILDASSRRCEVEGYPAVSS